MAPRRVHSRRGQQRHHRLLESDQTSGRSVLGYSFIQSPENADHQLSELLGSQEAQLRRLDREMETRFMLERGLPCTQPRQTRHLRRTSPLLVHLASARRAICAGSTKIESPVLQISGCLCRLAGEGGRCGVFISIRPGHRCSCQPLETGLCLRRCWRVYTHYAASHSRFGLLLFGSSDSGWGPTRTHGSRPKPVITVATPQQ